MIENGFVETFHLWPDGSESINGRLSIHDQDISQLADQFGTPLYVIDAKTIHNNIRAYQKTLANYPASHKIYYASKALLNSAIAQLITRADIGIDVVSLNELLIAEHAGVNLANVHFHGNGTPIEELRIAVQKQVGCILLDNLDQVDQIIRLTAEQNLPATVMLRIAPDVVAGGHAKIQTGAASAKFGFNIDDGSVAQAMDILLAQSQITVQGFHAHIGSQIRDMSAIRGTIGVLLDLAAQFKQAHGWEIAELSPGGGLAATTHRSQSDGDVDEYGEAVISAVIAHCTNHQLSLPTLSIEPGRSLVARAGVAVYRITGHKQIPSGETFIHVDGGMGDNPRPALYNAKYEAVLPEKLDAPLAIDAKIAGRFCESGDVLIDKVRLPKTAVNDLLAIPVAGAYTLSMASSYNGVGRAAVVLLHEGEVKLIQRRETIDDLLARDILLYGK